jgi:hypothetical protein
MFKVYNCIADAHDLRLVGLAALVCVLASFAAINLLHHARKSAGRMQAVWLGVSAISTGFGIWATHFIAMLAFTPGIPSGYNIALTLLSLVFARPSGCDPQLSYLHAWRNRARPARYSSYSSSAACIRATRKALSRSAGQTFT